MRLSCQAPGRVTSEQGAPVPFAGYRGHNAPPDYKFRVFTAGQKRRVTPQIKREFRRRAAIEPVIGHLKAEHRMGRNYLAHRAGDAINAVLAAVGCNLYEAFFVKQVFRCRSPLSWSGKR